MERNKKRLTLPLNGEGVFSPCFSQTQASPMTALSVSMGGLSCMGSTPKRRLSLSSIGETPPARPALSRHSSQSSGVSVGTPSPCDSPLLVEQFQPVNPQREHESGRHGVQFRRFNSMPLRIQYQDSPSFQPYHRPRLLRQEGIVENREECREEKEEEGEKEGLWMKPVGKRKGEEESETIADSERIWLDLPSPNEMEEEAMPSEGFTFTMPKPMSARTAPSTVPSLSFSIKESRPISAPATFLEASEDDTIQLRQDRLTSFHDDDEDDDGFSEIFDSADSQESEMPGCSDGLAGLFHGAILNPSNDIDPSGQPSTVQTANTENIPLSSVDCNTLRTTPSAAPRCRKGIFKIPSQPVLVRRNSSLLKRCERPRETPSPIQNKRPRSSSVASPHRDGNEEHSSAKKLLARSLSMMSPSDPYFRRIDQSLSVEGSQNNLIGDRTKACCLPTIPGKQKDLKSISPETLCHLIRSKFSPYIGECHIIDCRYPYEYEGGHIQGAINVYQEDELKRRFLDNPLPPLPDNKRRIFIFHCEFSSQRGPKMLRFLRKQDRSANLENYPALYYPELYLLNEGYKAFFEYSTEFCEPQTYTPMNHDNHLEDLRFFRAKSKSWTEKSRLKIRSQSLF